MATDAKDTSLGADQTKKRSWSGFDKPSDYFSSLKGTPKLFARRACYIRSPEEQMADKEAASGDMKKVLNWFHVMALGTGELSQQQQHRRDFYSPALLKAGSISEHQCRTYVS